MPRVTTTTEAKMTIMISGFSTWGPDVTVKQIHDDTVRAAVGYIGKLIEEQKNRIRLVSGVEVTIVQTVVINDG